VWLLLLCLVDPVQSIHTNCQLNVTKRGGINGNKNEKKVGISVWLLLLCLVDPVQSIHTNCQLNVTKRGGINGNKNEKKVS
jgi:hypothetical protein